MDEALKNSAAETSRVAKIESYLAQRAGCLRSKSIGHGEECICPVCKEHGEVMSLLLPVKL